MRKRVMGWIALIMLGLGGCVSIPVAPPPVAVQKTAQPAPLILISIDGFRPDYLERGLTPNLKALAEGGVSAAMRPSFPALTFPNHYTLVTGLRPDHHGIIGNSMRDPGKPDVLFRLANREAVTDRFWWDDAKPFWVTAQERGLKAATLFWPGSEAPIHGMHPTYWLTYNEDMPHPERVRQVLGWIDMPAPERPNAITLYYSNVDHEGHDHGPESPEVNAALKDVDQSIGQLIEGLRARGLIGVANIVIVSDHGMNKRRPEWFIKVADLLPRESYELTPSGQVAGFAPKPGYEALLKKVLIDTPRAQMTCWPKDKIPKRFKFGTHRRVPPIFCLANPGAYIISPSSNNWTPDPEGGDHGFDPDLPQMQAVFIASGPAFKSGVRLKAFDNVNVYGLIMDLLDLKPEPYDGTTAPLRQALRH